MILRILAVGAGGFIGSALRYWVSLLPFLHRGSLPLSTLLVNILGAVMIGMIVKTAELSDILNDYTTLFLKVGICGGFTTFSTFSLESLNLLEEGKSMLSIFYMILSVLCCIIGVSCGKWLISTLHH